MESPTVHGHSVSLKVVFDMKHAMSVKRTVQKSSSNELSPKSDLLKSQTKHFNAAKQNFLDYLEYIMINANYPSRVTASSFISLSFKEFSNKVPIFPHTEDMPSCILNYVRDKMVGHNGGKLSQLNIPVDRRRVRFALELEEVHYVNYPSATSKRQRWYEPADYLSFKEDIRATIMELYRARGLLNQLDMKKFTVSGLEKSLSLKQILARKRNGSIHVQTVLWQQTYCNDPMHIRQTSELFTKSSMQRARFRGMLDSELLGTFDKKQSEIDIFEAHKDPEYF